MIQQFNRMENNFEIDSGKSKKSGMTMFGRDDMSEIDQTEPAAGGDANKVISKELGSQSQHI